MDEGIPLLDLPDSGCRWPVDEDEMTRDHLFCGKPRYTRQGEEMAMPYCLEHCEDAYYTFTR